VENARPSFVNAPRAETDFDTPANFPAVESSLVGICPVPLALCRESDGQFLEVNPAMLGLLGLSAPHIVGRTDLELNLWQCEPMRTSGLRGLIERLPLRDLEVRIRAASGQIRTALLSVDRLSAPQPLLLVCAHDITEYEARQRKMRSAQKFDALGQFAAGFAHDFNNLLAVVQGYSCVLAEIPGLSESVRKCASAMTIAAERGANLTRQLMLFASRQAMELDEVELNDLLQEVTPLLKRILGPSIGITVKPADRPLFLRCDRKMIQQVLLTMAANARDAIDGTGSFTITVDSQTNPQSGALARIDIQDSGSGIDPQNVEKLFEPFFTTRDVGRGCGLGLATAYGIIKRHNGWIEVFSRTAAQGEIPGGTTFQIFLPLRDGLPGEKGSEERSNKPPHNNQTILLVEDENQLRLMVQSVLESLGYRVLTAENGVEALGISNENEINLLLTDMALPEGVSGSELAAQLKAAKPDLKIVYTSGYSLDLITHSTERLVEGENFLQKPYLPQTLAETLRRALVKVPGT
jgi:two-component system, cell cycle sensor histidine kinase and response regulator CckA